MNTDKELTIKFLMQEANGLYQELQKSGELKILSETELMHRYASLKTGPITDISDIADDEVPPINMKMINNVIKAAKIYNNIHKQKNKTITFSIVLKTVAMAASIIFVIGIGLTMILDSTKASFVFIDQTSQETTDYAIRVRTNGDVAGVFHDDFTKQLKTVLTDALSNEEGAFSCTLLADNNSGNEVLLTVKKIDSGRSVTKSIQLTTPINTHNLLSKVVPKIIKELSN